jgi:hypothetical protein
MGLVKEEKARGTFQRGTMEDYRKYIETVILGYKD